MRKVKVSLLIDERILLELRSKGINHLSTLVSALLEEFLGRYKPEKVQVLGKVQVRDLVKQMFSTSQTSAELPSELTGVLHQLQSLLSSLQKPEVKQEQKLEQKQEPKQKQEEPLSTDVEPVKPTKESFWDDREERFKFIENLVQEMIREQGGG